MAKVVVLMPPPVLPGLGLKINGFGVIENPELVWFAVLVAVTLPGRSLPLAIRLSETS